VFRAAATFARSRAALTAATRRGGFDDPNASTEQGWRTRKRRGSRCQCPGCAESTPIRYIPGFLYIRIAAIQIPLFALGAAGVQLLAMFSNTEFLLLTTISMTQGVVAVLINARTLRRTIGVGDHI
jgi:hypothetical protein